MSKCPYGGPVPTNPAAIAQLQSWLHLPTNRSGYQPVYTSSACANDLNVLYNDAVNVSSDTSEMTAYNTDCFQKVPWYSTSSGHVIIVAGGAVVLGALIYVAILRAK